jgi:hypothetical protein
MGIFPAKISALGIEFAKTDQSALLTIVALVTLYFLCAFCIYAASDFLAWRKALKSMFIERIRERFNKQREIPTSEIKEEEDFIREYAKNGRIVFVLSGPVSILRALFEFALPILVGLYSVVLLWSHKIPTTGN